MKNIFVIYLLILISCTTVIELDIPYESQVTVNSIFTPETFMSVTLTEGKSVTSEIYGFDSISDALVKVYEDGQFLTEMEMAFPSLYTSTLFKPSAGSSYELQIFRPDHETITAETTIPMEYPVYSLTDVHQDNELNNYEFTITLNDRPGKTYYEFMLKGYSTFRYEEDSLGNYSIVPNGEMNNLYLVSADPILGNVLTEDYHSTLLFEDKYFSEKSLTFTFRTAYLIFSISSSASQPTPTTRPHPEFLQFKLEGRIVPEEYYLYMKTVEKQAKNNTDPFGEPVMTYTNVQNGLGLFSSYNGVTMDLNLEYNP